MQYNKQTAQMTLSKKLDSLHKQLALCTDAIKKADLIEQIGYVEDELSYAHDLDEHEEMTCGTAQDRYIEQNSYALRQSDMIQQFRNEY